jgi:phosphopantetheinyl transferase (holo-ACP synthase)
MLKHTLYKSNRLLPQDIARKFTNLKQAKNYFVSRMALKICLNQEKLSWDELEVIDHLYLKNQPETLVSLSHTKEIGCALTSKIGSATQQGPYSIGVDIEESQRRIRPNAEKYFASFLDGESTPLKLWSLKEAAFKALWPRVNKTIRQSLMLSKIWVKNNAFGLIDSTDQLGKTSLDCEIFNNTQLNIAKAVLFFPTLKQRKLYL